MPATIVGTAGRDRLVGTDGPDVIVGFKGRDRITAGAGDDLVCGGGGADRITGGAGDDRLYGQNDAKGGETEGSPNRLVGGPGDDVIIGGKHGRDKVLYGHAHKPVTVRGRSHTIIGESTGKDRVRHVETIITTPFNDVVRCWVVCFVWSGAGDDVVRNGSRAETGDGNDRVFNGDPDVFFTGSTGPGDDIVRGACSRMDTDEGNDDVVVYGRCRVDAGPGDDTVVRKRDGGLSLGGDGNDTIIGGPESDSIFGGPGDDYLDGRDGDDSGFGEDGIDTCRGFERMEGCEA